MRWHAGRHGGSLKRIRILLVALSIPQGPSRAAWAALRANGKRQRLGGGDGEAASGTAQRAACGRCERRESWRRQLAVASTNWQLWHALSPRSQRVNGGRNGGSSATQAWMECAAWLDAQVHTLSEARRRAACHGPAVGGRVSAARTQEVLAAIPGHRGQRVRGHADGATPRRVGSGRHGQARLPARKRPTGDRTRVSLVVC